MPLTPAFKLALALLIAPGLAAAGEIAAAEERLFEFTYEVQDTDLPADEAIDIYLPLPSEQYGQRVLAENIETNLAGQRKREPVYGNDYYHLRREAGDSEPVNATLNWTIARSFTDAPATARLTPEERELYLGPNSRVPVGHEILEPILGEIHASRTDASPAATARAIYDWVVDNVEYKKVGTGWGNGDTFWACNERYGNCTDFHALFISLARSEGIPARFEIGFPVPQDREEGSIGGYHCWVRFYLPGEGWVPIDASEAAKHPELRETLFGSQPADRIHFTTGRDLLLDGMAEQHALNYFVYPQVLVGGKPWMGKVSTKFSFQPAAVVAER